MQEYSISYFKDLSQSAADSAKTLSSAADWAYFEARDRAARSASGKYKTPSYVEFEAEIKAIRDTKDELSQLESAMGEIDSREGRILTMIKADILAMAEKNISHKTVNWETRQQVYDAVKNVIFYAEGQEDL